MTAPSAWVRRSMPVPPAWLHVDDDIAVASPKGYSARDLDAIVRTVPAVYASLRRGVTHDQFLAARASGDPRLRAVGDTYVHLFGMSPSAEVLTADLTDDGLQVAKGNHRVRAAQAAGVPFLPVEVRARTAAELDRLETAMAARCGPDHEQLVAVHRRADRDRAGQPTSAPGRGPSDRVTQRDQRAAS